MENLLSALTLIVPIIRSDTTHLLEIVLNPASRNRRNIMPEMTPLEAAEKLEIVDVFLTREAAAQALKERKT